MSAGVWTGKAMLTGSPLTASAVCISAIILFIFYYFRLTVCLFTAGLTVFLVHNYTFISDLDLYGALDGQKMTVSGKVSAVTNHGTMPVFTVRGKLQDMNGDLSAPVSVSCRLRNATVLKGDYVTVTGKFRTFSDPLNRHERNMKDLGFNNLVHGRLEKAVLIYRSEGNMLDRGLKRVKDSAEKVFRNGLSFKAGNFLSAVMLGSRDRLEPGDMKMFADSGTVHLLAVSGLHVGFLMLLLTALKRIFRIRGNSFLFFAGTALFMYALLTGSSPSVVRAVLMAVIVLITFPLKRKMKLADVIGSAGIISLMIDPNKLFMPGFILSFSAVISIAVIYVSVSERLDKRSLSLSGKTGKLVDGLVLSVSVTAGVMPPVLYFFGRYNLLSVLTNLIMIPLTGLVFFSGLVYLAVHSVPLISGFTAFLAETGVKALYLTAGMTKDPGILTLMFSPGAAGTFVMLLLSVSIFYIRDIRKKLVLSSDAAVIMVLMLLSDPVNERVYIFKAEKCTAYLIRSGVSNILYCGELTGSDMTNVIGPYLVKENVRRIDQLICFLPWYETETIIRSLKIPVGTVISDRDMFILNEMHTCIDLRKYEYPVAGIPWELIIEVDRSMKLISGEDVLTLRTDGIFGLNGKKFSVTYGTDILLKCKGKGTEVISGGNVLFQ